MTHICIGNLTITGSDNGLSPGWRQSITWTNVGILLIGPLGTNFSEILIKIQTFSFKKIHFKMAAILSRPQCVLYQLTLDMLNCFKVYKRHIHILNCILDLAWPKWMKLTLTQQYMLFALHSQYHACWCFGDLRRPWTGMVLTPKHQKN